MKASLIFPLLLVLSIVACRKPAPSVHNNPEDFANSLSNIEPVVFSTSLKDTLPASALESLGLSNINGIEVKYLDGHNARYFGYYADEKTLLKTISMLPFSKHAAIADTLCRRISYNDLNFLRQHISSTEYENTSFFWNADPKDVVVYECIKSPSMHTLLINRKTGLVLHRIESHL